MALSPRAITDLSNHITTVAVILTHCYFIVIRSATKCVKEGLISHNCLEYFDSWVIM